MNNNLEKIAIITTETDVYSVFLKEMYKEKNTSYEYNNNVFYILWYNETTGEYHTSDYTGQKAYIKYDYTMFDTSYTQYMFDVVNKCTKSYFSNDLGKIKNIEYLNNRFILNELKFKD